MRRLALLGLLPFLAALPAAAQTMDHSSMPGMAMPGMSMPTQSTKPARKPKSAAKGPAKRKTASRTHAHQGATPGAGHTAASKAAAQGAAPPPAHGAPSSAGSMDHGAMPGMSMPGAPPALDHPAMPGMSMPGSAPAEDHAAMPGMEMGTAQAQIPKSPPPPAPTDHAADYVFDPAAMAAARRTVQREHGGARLSMVFANILEYQARSGGGGYRWDGEAWYGSDINRLVLKSEGEGTRREGVEGAELQALYSRAIGPYFDVQAGVRQDFEPHDRTYATLGVEGLAPYWFDVQGALFLSNKGELLGRFEGTYDLRLTQRLILQPRAELNFAAQDTIATRTGSGLSNAELGLRLRYEIRREFAPYIGVSYDRKFGKTADYARTLGEDRAATSFVAGVRTWF